MAGYSDFDFDMANKLIENIQMTDSAKEMVRSFASHFIINDNMDVDVDTKLCNAYYALEQGNVAQAKEEFESACKAYGSHHGCTHELLGTEEVKTVYDGMKLTIEGIEFTFRLVDEYSGEYSVTKLNRHGVEKEVVTVNDSDPMNYIEWKIRDAEMLY